MKKDIENDLSIRNNYGYNTPEWKKRARNKLKNSQDSLALGFLEASWHHLNQFYEESIARDEDVQESPLSEFLYFISVGMYPPPEILLSISKSFELYFQKEGELPLEEAFFKRPKTGVGNFSARKAEQKKYIVFHQLFVGLNKEKKSLEVLAEEYFKGSNELFNWIPKNKQNVENFFDSFVFLK